MTRALLIAVLALAVFNLVTAALFYWYGARNPRREDDDDISGIGA